MALGVGDILERVEGSQSRTGRERKGSRALRLRLCEYISIGVPPSRGMVFVLRLLGIMLGMAWSEET